MFLTCETTSLPSVQNIIPSTKEIKTRCNAPEPATIRLRTEYSMEGINVATTTPTNNKKATIDVSNIAMKRDAVQIRENAAQKLCAKLPRNLNIRIVEKPGGERYFKCTSLCGL